MTTVEELTILSRTNSYGQIRELTGIPESTISYVIRGERELPAKYTVELTAAAYYAAFDQLRSNGAGLNSAYTIGAGKLSEIDKASYEYSSIAEKYAKQNLIGRGYAKYDEETNKSIFYGLDREIHNMKWRLQNWNISLEDLRQQPPPPDSP